MLNHMYIMISSLNAARIGKKYLKLHQVGKSGDTLKDNSSLINSVPKDIVLFSRRDM